MDQIKINLVSGVLSLTVDRSDMPLDDLCGFAVRQNPKRGFLFVSKVLGKHWPVRPSDAYKVYEMLAYKLGEIDGPVWSVGLAETATGFAQGVMQAWVNKFNKDTFFQITTRYPVPFVDAIGFEEAHSHASAQYIHAPSISTAENLILIDDEITTGNTLKNLANRLIEVAPNIKTVTWVALKSWMSKKTKMEIDAWAKQNGLSIKIVALLEGEYDFKADPNFSVELPDNSETTCVRQLTLGLDNLRVGIVLSKKEQEVYEKTEKPECILVVGVGECNEPAMSLGRRLELSGHEVYVQSATRSPILVGGAIDNTLTWEDPYKQGVPHYFHNMNKTKFSKALLVAEVSGVKMPSFFVDKI